MISFDDFKKVEVTVGKILSAEKVPETDKLLKLSVDFGNNTNYEQDTKVRTETTTPQSPPLKGGEESTTPSPSLPGGQTGLEKEGREKRDIRQIVSGIAISFPDPAVLVGKKCMFVTNLEPRVIKGLTSNGMLFAVSTEEGQFSLLEPSGDIPPGTKAK